MAQCYLTGVHRPIHQMYKLERGRARQLAAEYRRRAAQVERLLEQLGPVDREVTIDAEGIRSRKRVHRLVCSDIARTLSKDLETDRLFVHFVDWLKQRRTQQGADTSGDTGACCDTPTAECNAGESS